VRLLWYKKELAVRSLLLELLLECKVFKQR